MAKHVITQLVDDLTGGAADETVQFGLDGKDFEIDLSRDHVRELRDHLEQFVLKATRVRPSEARAYRAPVDSDRGQREAIRVWAAKNGIEIAVRGRIKDAVVRQWAAEQGAPAVRAPAVAKAATVPAAAKATVPAAAPKAAVTKAPAAKKTAKPRANAPTLFSEDTAPAERKPNARKRRQSRVRAAAAAR